MPGIDQELRGRVTDFYARYAECICDDALEMWPEFFAEDCLYKIIPRVNHDRGLPVSLVLVESRGGLVDRMTAIRNTMVFAPRYVSPSISSVRIVSRHDGILTTRSMFSVHQTLADELTTLLMVGRSFDKIDVGGSEFKFVERVLVSDSESLPSTIVYPI